MTTELVYLQTQRQRHVPPIFDYLMNAIPPIKANESRQKLAKQNQAMTLVDTEIKVHLLFEYQNYCHPNKQKKLMLLGKALEDETKKENAAHAATNAARDETYLLQITKAMADLSPGAMLYYLQGTDHFSRLSPQLNKLNTFFIETTRLWRHHRTFEK